MKNEKLELLFLQLRNSIAKKEFYTVCANSDTANSGGWSCDWYTGM